MENTLSDEKMEEQFNKIDTILKEHGDALQNHSKLKSALDERKTLLSVLASNHWLPRDAGRKLIMLIILIIGISGTVTRNSECLYILLILPFFSPKIIMLIAIIVGYMKGNHKK